MDNHDTTIANVYHASTKLLYLDFQRKPPAYKRYHALPALLLPTEFSLPAVSTLMATAAAMPSPSTMPGVDTTTLASLLYFSAGRIRKRNFSGAGEVFFRAAASAGGLYPVEVYVVCGPLPDLEAGVYHFSPADFALRCLRHGDYREALGQASGDDSTVLHAPVTLVFSVMFWRSAWKYRLRSYRYCFWDNGTVLANLLAATAACGMPASVRLSFVDDQINQLLGIDGQREASTCLVPIGAPQPQPAQAEMLPVPPMAAETVPTGVEEIDYPEMQQLHAASVLRSPSEVIAWRGTVAMPLAQATGARYPMPSSAPELSPPRSLEEVIRQRGSTRRFARQTISFAQLSAIVDASTTGIPADFLGQDRASLLHLYLIVNAVEGLPSGSYIFDPQGKTLGCLQAGEFREEAGHLCFEQALGADASAVVFFLADLERVLQRFGNRGYRAVQLEAGIMGGKMYLCAYSLGLGASGLTFYDDEVTAFFAPHATGKNAIFVVALGYTAAENRVRPYRSRVGMILDARSRKEN